MAMSASSSFEDTGQPGPQKKIEHNAMTIPHTMTPYPHAGILNSEAEFGPPSVDVDVMSTLLEGEGEQDTFG